jgi:hypothetical protein
MILFVLLCQIVEPYQCIPDRMPLEREITEGSCKSNRGANPMTSATYAKKHRLAARLLAERPDTLRYMARVAYLNDQNARCQALNGLAERLEREGRS